MSYMEFSVELFEANIDQTPSAASLSILTTILLQSLIIYVFEEVLEDLTNINVQLGQLQMLQLSHSQVLDHIKASAILKLFHWQELSHALVVRGGQNIGSKLSSTVIGGS